MFIQADRLRPVRALAIRWLRKARARLGLLLGKGSGDDAPCRPLAAGFKQGAGKPTELMLGRVAQTYTGNATYFLLARQTARLSQWCSDVRLYSSCIYPIGLAHLCNASRAGRLLAAFVASLLLLPLAEAQTPTNPDLLPSYMIPKSPTVVPFQRVDEQRYVDLITGGAQTSLPLADISSGALNLPVALGYSYTGLQVYRSNDLIGLGWSLQAGGSISRQLGGQPDGMMPSWRAYSPAAVNAGLNNPLYVKNAATNDIDVIPDVFTFQFPGGSGRFMLLDTSIVLLPQQPLRVRRRSDGSFLIVTEQGVRYEFSATETTQPNPNNFGNVGTYVSAWQMTRVISGDNSDTIRLHYTRRGYTPPMRWAQTVGELFMGDNQDIASRCNTTVGAYKIHNVKTLGSHIQAQYLDSITTRGARLVLERSLTNGVLRRVRLLGDYPRRERKTITLFQSVFENSSSLDPVMRLDRVQECAAGTCLPAYLFAYETGDGEEFPIRQSVAQDHWGYYNGAINNGGGNGNISDANTETTQSALLADPILGIRAAVRNPNFNFSRLGSLRRISYPTGGTTMLDYEANVLALDEVIEIRNSSPVLQLAAGYTSQTPPNTLETATGTFQVHYSGTVSVMLSRQPYYGGGVGSGGSNRERDFNLWKILPGGDSLVTDLTASYNYKCIEPHTERLFEFELGPGTYRATLYCERTEFNSSLDISAPYILRMTSAPGPGIRVRQVTTTASGATPLVRRYQYTEGDIPTGRSLLPLSATGEPGFERQSFQRIQLMPDNNTQSVTCPCIQTSSDNTGLGNEYNRHVFYNTRVTELLGSGEGYIVHDFDVLPSLFKEVTPTGRRTYRHDIRQPQRVQLAEKERHWYSGDSARFFPALRLRMSVQNLVTANADEYSAQGFDIWASFASIRRSEYTRYDERGDSLVQVTLSGYRKQRLVRQATRTATGWHISRYKYLADYSPTLPVVRALQVHNFNPIIETQNWRSTLSGQDSVLVGGLLNLYDPQWRSPAGIWALDLTRPVAMPNAETRSNGFYMGFKSDTRYRADDSITYQLRTGLLQQRLKPHLPATVYVWGYNRTHVIAQIENATYAQVQTVLSQATLDRLQGPNPGTDEQVRQLLAPLRTALPQARVTSYTYLPLVGMTSQTDPSGRISFYEYDALGRLLRTRDEQGRLLAEQEYHYARP
ncbi:RHS repeat domain-containing protein [Hymenobacter gummosus]|nr:RHS repeat domain-containing protein [Hymenobacter gummosus]